ncbi:MAG: hypothetical protein M1308_23325 [Actinobacteria bacterium]|nr:hypothetical protein [Actinomycetota bacterium]
MKKKILLIGFIVSIVLILLLPFQDYLVKNIYTKTPLNLCFLSYGIGLGGDVGYSIRENCYSTRAYKLNEWQSCFGLKNSGTCLANLTKFNNKYLCDKTSNSKIKYSCAYWILRNYDKDINDIHQYQGIEKYRIYEEKTFRNGDLFGGNPLTILSDNNVEFFINSRFYCSEKEEPPIAANLTAGESNFIFITSCIVRNNIITIKYFRYGF